MSPLRLAPLASSHRARVAELLVATASFSTEEIDVALELFDAAASDTSFRASPQQEPSFRASPQEEPSFRASPKGESRNLHPSPDYELLGAFDDEHLVGYACFGPTPSTEGTWDLYWLAVDPAAQGQGVGRTLVRAVEDTLRSRGARLVVVETSSRADYENTRAFYRRTGYAEAARVRDFYAPADDRIILTTRLMYTPGGVATQ